MVWSLLVVEPEPIFREGLRAVIAQEPDFRVVGEAAGAEAALDLATRLQPAIVSIEIALPGQGGLAVARELMRRQPSLGIVVLTSHLSQQYVAEALSDGVRGYVGKDQPPSELIRALRLVADGQSYLAPSVSRFVLDEYVRMNRAGQRGPLLALTPRERDIFALTVRGTPAGDIAARLAISRRTVDTHRTRVLRKLQVHSTADLVRLAARMGMLEDAGDRAGA